MKPATILHYPVTDTENELQLELLGRTSPFRPQVEDFIHHVFAHAYGANLQHFMPTLLSLHTGEDKLLAALGMRTASEGPLFLENYFDTPIEETLHNTSGQMATRDRIIELGNMASVHRGGLRLLIIALTAYLKGCGTEWVVFTAVPIVLRAFAALKLPLHLLGAADKARLGQEQEDWGSYYDHAPVVVAGRVADGFDCLQRAIHTGTLLRFNDYLWERAYNAGNQQRLNCQSYMSDIQITGLGQS